MKSNSALGYIIVVIAVIVIGVIAYKMISGPRQITPEETRAMMNGAGQQQHTPAQPAAH